jgi:hypothetical protein
MDDKNKDAGVDQEWGPEAAEAMCNEVRHFPVMSGNESSPWSVGDLIDHTPKDLISKVKLEEIVFQTWFGGRTVLMGDGMQLYVLAYLFPHVECFNSKYTDQVAHNISLSLFFSLPQGNTSLLSSEDSTISPTCIFILTF